MDQNASDTRAGSPPQPNVTGMNSTLKIAVPVFLLMAVVFGITFFSQYTPRSSDEPGGGAGPGGEGNEPPLRFFSASRAWDPPDTFSPELGAKYRGLRLLAPSGNPAKVEAAFDFSLQDRIFPTFFEMGETLHGTTFWFENRHTRPVVMQLKGVNCPACSGGRVAPIPPDVTRQLLQMTAVGALPQGLFNGLPLGMVGPGANLQPERLAWQQHTYREEPDAQYTVPAANDTDGWSPQWGILELQFKVSALGPKDPPLTAKFATQVEGGPGGHAEIAIHYVGANAFELVPAKIEIGELTANSDPRRFDVVVFSSTRGPGRTGPGEPGDLLPPRADIRMLSGVTDPGQFVTVTPPVRVPQQELAALTDQLFAQLRRPLQVESAYRMSVLVNPRVGQSRIDIGLLERDLWVVVPGAQERRVRISGMVRGPIWLDNERTDIDLGSYANSSGIPSVTQKLVTEQREAEVVVVGVEGEAADFLKPTLEKLPPSADHGYYALKLTVPPRAGTGAWSGVIVLEVKGPTPQRLRIPVKGNGRLGR